METYVVFSQLDFDGLGIRVDWPLCVQSGVCVVQPGLQLRQGMLELTQSQQGSLQLVLRVEERQRQDLKNRNSNIWTVMKSICQIHAVVQNANKDQHPQLPKGNIGVRAGSRLPD